MSHQESGARDGGRARRGLTASRPSGGRRAVRRAASAWCEQLENRLQFALTFPNVLVNNMSADTTSKDTQSETSTIAFGNTVLTAYNDSGSNAVSSNRFTGWSRSTDGGGTFTDMGLLPTDTNGDAGDPVLARDNTSGAVYMATLSFGSKAVIQVFKSTDGGATFGAPVNACPNFTGGSLDKEWLAVDNFAGSGRGNVYLVVRDFGTKNGIFVTRSTDGGATWGPSGGVALTTGSSTQGAWVTVGPDHSVYAFWLDGQSTSQRILMRKSTDQGLTFAPAVTVATLLTTGTNGDFGLGFRTDAFPQAVVGANGNIYLAYPDNPAGTDRCDIYFTQSSDGGTTWSTPIRVNDDATTRDQWQPALAIKPNGTQLFIGWYDRRNDANNTLIDTYGTVGSISGSGVTFQPNFRITDTAFAPVYGVDPVINTVYMGDYDSASADNGYFYYSWADNRDNSIGRSGKQANVRLAKISTGMQVVSSTPAAGSIVSAAPGDFTISLSDAYDPASVDAADLTVNGAPADSFTAVDADTITFHFNSSPVTAEGQQSMAIAAGALLRSADGGSVQAFGANFRYDLTPMQVASIAPAAGSSVTLPLTTIDVTLNEPYDPATLGTGDLTLSQGTVTGAAAVDADTVRYTVSGLTSEGTLNLSIPVGALTDAYGNPMQSYAGSYTLDIGTVAFPTPMGTRLPQGALIYQSQSSNQIGTAGDSDSFTLSLDAGQALMLLVSGGSSLRAQVEVRDASNNLLGTATAAAAGQYAMLQAVPIAAAGTYTITVSGAAGTTGAYTAQAYVNAAAEAEQYAGGGGGGNDTLATAQDLDPSFTSLGGASSRGAVVGQLPIAGGTPVFTDGFESGTLSSAWTTYSSDPSLGRIQVTGANGTGSGSFALAMDHNDPNGAIYNLNEAVWSVNLAGLTQASLTFQQASWSDEDDALPASFTGHANGDGVSISADGNTWYRVWQAVSGAAGTFGTVTVDLAAAASSAGIPLTSISKVKFQQYDNYNISTDGRVWDNAAITTPSTNLDNYRLTLAAGDSLTLGLKFLTAGAAPAMKLLDSAGNLLATGVGGSTNLDRVLSDFVAPADGIYYVQLTGTGGDYSLVATRNAGFDTESNDTTAVAQKLRSNQTSGEQRVLGNIGGTAASLFDFTDAQAEPVNGLHYQGARFGFTVDGTSSSEAVVDQPPPELDALEGESVLRGNAAGVLSINFDHPVSSVGFTVGLAFPDGEPSPGGTDEDEETAIVARIYDAQGKLIRAQQIRPDPLDGDDVWQADFGYDESQVGRIELDFGQDPDVEFALGALAVTSGNTVDTYAVTLAAGATVQLQTSTPNAGSGEPVNNLNPRLRLLSSTGAQLALDDNSAPDGRNANLVYTATSAGTYYVEVSSTTASSTIGDYVLTVTGASAPAAAYTVTATTPANGTTLAVAPTQITVDFSDSFLVSSLEASDLLLDGTPLTSVTLVDADTASFAVPAGLAQGSHTFSLAAGSVTDIHGNALSAFSGSFTFDNTAPRVVSTSIQEGDVRATGSLTYTVVFNKAMLTSNLDSSDFTLRGNVRGVSYSPSTYGYSADAKTLTITYSTSLPEDSYTLTLLSGNGRFESTTGVDLDGEPVWPIPPNVSGNGVEGGNFLVNFSNDISTVAFPTPWTSRAPVGSLIYDSTTSGLIGPAGDADNFTVSLDAGQTLTVDLLAPAATLRGQIDLLDASNNVVASATAAAAGQEAVLQTFALPAAGTYTVRVTGAGNTTGSYSLQAILNAAVEAEDHSGAADDTVATAQNLDAGFLSLGSGASRAAVVGKLPTLSTAGGDYYSLTLADGDSISAAVGRQTGSAGETLTLLDAGGNVLANGPAGVTNADLAIANFVVVGGGTYYLRVAGTTGATYDLAVTRNADFEREANDTQATAQTIDPAVPVLGYLASGNDDYYQFDVAAGGALTITTATPGDGTRDFVNTLNPRLELYDPYGALVASDDNSGGDARNAKITYTAAASGSYRLRVSYTSSATGEYVVTVARPVAKLPVPGTPDLLDASDSGVSASDNVTNANNAGGRSLQFSVANTVAGATVTLYANGVAIGSAVASGSTTVVTTGGAAKLNDGTFTFTARQTLAAAESPDSLGLAVTIDATAPTAPAAPDLAAASDSGLSNTDNITNVAAPSFAVTASPYFRFFRNGTLLSGNYQTGTSYLMPAQANGTFAAAVAAVDVAGNVSALGPALNVTIDTVAPAAPGAPDLQPGSDSGQSNSDDKTSAQTPTFDLVGSEPGVLHLDVDGSSGNGTALSISGGGTYGLTLNPPASKFATAASYPTGSRPSMVATGDLNNDGRDDVVAANSTGSTISPFLANADGTLAVAQQIPIPSGSNATTPLLGDFNGDGKLDLLARTNASIYFWAGNGDGTFKAATSVTAPSAYFYMTDGDVNGDGKLDLIIPGTTNVAYAMLGNGDGTFQSAKSSSIAAAAYEAALADFNGDGKLDFVGGSSTNTIVYAAGNGDGTFQTGSVVLSGGSNLIHAIGADLNGDGKLDIIGGDNGTHAVYVLLGNGNGTFQPVQSYAGAGGSQVLAVDLNRDGRLDVAATNNGTLVYVLTGNGNGTLQAPTAYTVGSGSWGVAAADVNGDKIPDLVCANQNSNTISVLRGLGGSLSNGVHTFAAWAEDVAGNKSPVSPSLSATFDTIAPTADVLDVSPDPRDVPVDQVNIVFSEPVYGFDLGDVALTRNGLGVSLATATLTTSDNITWTVGNLGGATGQSGSYVLSLTATGTGITDVVGNALAAAASDAFKVQTNVITGTSGSDTYYLKSDGAGGILVYENNPNTSGPADYTIPAASVNSLTIDTGDGNDVVTFGTALPVAPALVGGTGNKTLSVNAGAATFGGDLGAGIAHLTVNVANGAAVTFAATQHLDAMNLAGTATAVLAQNGARCLVLGQLSIAAGAFLDLKDNDLILRSGSVGSWDGTAYTGVSGLLQLGSNGGAWNGAGGVGTTMPGATAGYTTLAVASAGDLSGGQPMQFDGEILEPSALVVKYTYAGDANLDGVVNIDDYTQIDSSVAVGGTLKGWFNGDFNYDGNVDIDDYTIIDGSIGIQGPPL